MSTNLFCVKFPWSLCYELLSIYHVYCWVTICHSSWIAQCLTLKWTQFQSYIDKLRLIGKETLLWQFILKRLSPLPYYHKFLCCVSGETVQSSRLYKKWDFYLVINRRMNVTWITHLSFIVVDISSPAILCHPQLRPGCLTSLYQWERVLSTRKWRGGGYIDIVFINI